ncbi:kinase [Pseudoalteromonas tunicata]|uniref:kinase n=1 Tax=Pseudoalteromonas tunicata TaxID=314281 RepID=UPI00273F2D03|nr:kinase [Pseudoalteromonas tunicata]MDP4983543.1 kinase [Pseudoalteromonas tunicata]MDP5211891.1 kinase [Pseudoalteromonas tunicata]
MSIAKWQLDFLNEYQLPHSYLYQIEPVVQRILNLYQHHRVPKPWLLAINGAQGSGKSTLSAYLVAYFKWEKQKKALVLSLDDYYYSPKQRADVAKHYHPLFRTRGVPGTHDIKQAIADVNALLAKQPCLIPRFDKSQDCVFSQEFWQSVDEPQDVVIFEGWCVGLPAEPANNLLTPINHFEQTCDADGRFRQLVNQHLAAAYQDLFALFEHLIYLRMSDFNHVLAWRQKQEHKLIAKTGSGLSDEQVQDFIAYFERLTRYALKSLPAKADIIVDVLANHQLALV